MSDLSTFESAYLAAEAVGDVAVLKFRKGLLTEDDNVDQLDRDFQVIVDHYGFQKVAVDLSPVRYLTSAVLGKIILFHRRVRRGGGRLVLCGAQPTVSDILSTSSLIDYFELAVNTAAGVEKLAQTA